MPLFLSLLVVALALCALCRRRFEVLLPGFAGGLILVCYLLALFQGLGLFPWLSYLAALGWMLAQVLTGRGRELGRSLLAHALTPGLAAFGLLALLFILTMGEHVVWATDDLYYWAVQVKGLYAQQGLVDGIHHLAPRFMTYTPGMQLFQWIGVAMAGEFSEGTLYMGLALFYAVFLLPFGQGITWRKAYYLPLLLVFCLGVPTVIFRDAYAMLRVDTALGVCLGSALCQAWSLDKKASWVDCAILALTLTTLVLVKQVGAFWALLPMALLFWPKRAGSVPQRLFLVGLPLAAVGSWYLFAHVAGLTGQHMRNLTWGLEAFSQGSYAAPQALEHLPATLWNALLYRNGSSWPGVPMLLWAAVVILFPALTALGEGERRGPLTRLSLWWTCCFGLMLAAFGAIFATAFIGEFDAFVDGTLENMHYLLERYLGPFFLGGLLMAVHLGMKSPRFPKARLPVAVACLALLVSWGQLYQELVPSAYAREAPRDIAIYQEENFWVEDVEDLEDPLGAVILYGINPTPFRPEFLQYPLAPVKIVTLYGDIDEAYFLALLQGYGITHVLCVDDANPTYEAAVAFTEDGYLDTYTLYQVDWAEGVPLLRPW